MREIRPIKEGTSILCPVCGFEYNHESKPEYVVIGRDNKIIVPMRCENEHNWIFIINHHEGICYITYEVVK